MKKILLLSLLLLVAMAITIPARAINQATVVNLETGHRKAVNVGDSHAFDNNYELEIDYGVKLISEEELGFSVVSSYKTTLSASMTSTQSTINASSVTSKDDTTLSMAILGERAYLTIEPGGSKEEIVMCTGISGTAWTGCTRGLAFTGTSTAAVAANRKTHSAGSTLIMSNVHYVYDELVDKDTAETIAGIKTFASTTIPRLDSYLAPTLDNEFAPKKYVDDVALVSAPDATETVKGVSELATAAEAAAGTSSGSAARLVLPASIASSSNDVAGNHVVMSEADGYINQNRLDLSEDFAFSGDNSFTGTTAIATSTMFGVQGGFMPSGSITAYATTTAPEGWLACDGSEISSTTFSSLFAVIGYSYGGSPGGDFNLPNLNGRNIIGYGSATTTIDTMGETGGQGEHVQSIDEMPSHTHDIDYGYSGSGDFAFTYGLDKTGVKPSDPIGGGSAFNVLDPYIVLRYIIKY